MDYPLLKYTHVTTATLSALLFLLRWVWSVTGSPHLQRPWTRVLPHVNDSLLFASGLSMALTLRQYPFVQPWLTAKFLALLGYIVLGSIAIKRGRTRRRRLWSGIVALLCLGYLISVALSRSPLPWPVALGS